MNSLGMTASLHTTVMSPGHYCTSQNSGKGKVKGKVVPASAIQDYRETKGVALLILNLSATWR